MVTTRQIEDGNFLFNYGSPQQPRESGFSFEGVKVPIYHFGIQSQINSSTFPGLSCGIEGEQSILDSVLLAQWEDRMLKGHFQYDVTTSEIKVIGGCRKFIAQLNEGWNMIPMPKQGMEFCCQQDHLVRDWMKDHEKLLFCVASGEQKNAELVPSASVPNGAIMMVINATPVEYGHILLVSCGAPHLYSLLDARSLEMFTRFAVEINNCSFRLFYDCQTRSSSLLYFQGCYFSNPLSVELMPVVSFFSDGKMGIRICSVFDYPIKTLLFESSHNIKLMVRVLAEICHGLLERSIPYNLLITDCGKKVFLFLQMTKLSKSSSISAWECGGYFLFKSRHKFDEANEDDMVKHLSAFSLDDKGFQSIKELCSNVARKITGS